MKNKWITLLSVIGLISIILFIGCASGTGNEANILTSKKVSEIPIIDGNGSDTVWENAKPITTHDNIANSDITIKSVYSDEKIFFLVTYTDSTENRKHKYLIWDKDTETYKNGPTREDTFVFKWAMDPNTDDLRLDADMTYEADIWFWKADRTDPTGYADDKMQIYSATELPESLKLSSKNGNYFYLMRPGDEGNSTYKDILYETYVGDEVPKTENDMPTGSRADIKAKGLWQNGIWTIEFGRKLDTGHEDDIQFKTTEKYKFAVSKFEIAGRNEEENSEQPLYGAGEITGIFTLVFK